MRACSYYFFYWQYHKITKKYYGIPCYCPYYVKGNYYSTEIEVSLNDAGSIKRGEGDGTERDYGTDKQAAF